MGDPDSFIGFSIVRADVVIAADGATLWATYTIEFPDRAGSTSGQLGPVIATASRIEVEVMGEPVAPVPAPGPSEEMSEEAPLENPAA
jgi:hypothetical protein